MKHPVGYYFTIEETEDNLDGEGHFVIASTEGMAKSLLFNHIARLHGTDEAQRLYDNAVLLYAKRLALDFVCDISKEHYFCTTYFNENFSTWEEMFAVISMYVIGDCGDEEIMVYGAATGLARCKICSMP